MVSAKTKDKTLKILEGRNAQDGKEQKKHMVYLEMKFYYYFFSLKHLYTELVPYVLKIYASLLNIHPCGLVISYCIIKLDDHLFRKWLVT